MSTTATRVDQETVYRLLMEERWTELLDLVYRNRTDVADDPLLKHAVDVFARTFVERLPTRQTEWIKADVEKLFLLHAGGFHRLEGDPFEQVILALVDLHADDPVASAGYARHLPENPRCAAILERFDVRRGVLHSQRDLIDLHDTRPAPDADYRIPLFKSRREVEFFLAVREVFATYLVYPNVAISTVLDFDAIKPGLSSEERSYFFRGVVDCVVFDQHGDYRPIHFFEVDSALHDDPGRSDRDAMKDRIFSAAGQRLVRVRPRDPSAGRDAYVRLLHGLLRDE